jgi:biopolymer transport protein TolQ
MRSKQTYTINPIRSDGKEGAVIAGSMWTAGDILQLSVAQDLNLWTMVFDASFIVMFVLVLLVSLSVASWGIILYKYLMLRAAHRQSVQFLDLFWSNRRLDKIYEGSESMDRSPIAHIFRAGYVELTKSRQKPEDESDRGQAPHKMTDMQSIERSLRRTQMAQITLLERLVSFLATTGSTAPFIGLFGTVWGIMESFHKIGQVGNATLATVAPGISEALIATATGLAAAIPAVVGYNYFVQRIKVLDVEMDNFASDFLNIIRRHFSE